MNMSETYYRFHQGDAPAFSAGNAWSALWGSEFSADGTQNRCHGCDGEGTDWDREDGTCQTCDGTCWEDCLRGYSCCWDAESLIDYFAERGIPADDHGVVVIFTGRRVGSGFDGEPLAIPEIVTGTLTWAEFTARTAA